MVMVMLEGFGRTLVSGGGGACLLQAGDRQLFSAHCLFIRKGAGLIWDLVLISRPESASNKLCSPTIFTYALHSGIINGPVPQSHACILPQAHLFNLQPVIDVSRGRHSGGGAGS